VRRYGLARAIADPLRGVDAFAAPVFDHSGRVVLVITAMGPAGTSDAPMGQRYCHSVARPRFRPRLRRIEAPWTWRRRSGGTRRLGTTPSVAASQICCSSGASRAVSERLDLCQISCRRTPEL